MQQAAKIVLQSPLEDCAVETMRGKATYPLDRPGLERLVAPYQKVVLDIGTGDGKFIYRSARARPEAFFIGIDPARDGLQEVSSRISRKPSRGGVPNALFLVARVEELPAELDGLAGEAHIIMPWGSLLEGCVLANERILGNVARTCAPGARIRILINTSIFGDPVPREMAHLPPLTLDYVDSEMAPDYARAGLPIVEREMVAGREMAKVPTSWAKRMAFGRDPQSLRIEAERVALGLPHLP